MKSTLLNIADQIAERLGEYKSFPRTQATDAMTGVMIDLEVIIRKAAEDLPDESLEDRIHKIISTTLKVAQPTKTKK